MSYDNIDPRTKTSTDTPLSDAGESSSEQVGAIIASLQQQQLQRELDMAYQQHMEEQMYPKQQLDWLSTQVRGMAPITPQMTTQSTNTTGATYSPSPLSQLASGVFAYKGLTG